MNRPVSGLSAETWARFRELPAVERFHVAARAFSAPLEQVAARVPQGKTLEIGCGHGLLSVLIAQRNTRAEVLGLDPDSRKVAWAKKASATLPQLRFIQGEAATLSQLDGETFDAVVICDVLYLLAWETWRGVLVDCRRLLRPGGRLILKEVEGDRSWRHLKAWLQEWVMTVLLRRTLSSGGRTLVTRQVMATLLESCGFQQEEILPLGAGYTTPHILYVARKPA